MIANYTMQMAIKALQVCPYAPARTATGGLKLCLRGEWGERSLV